MELAFAHPLHTPIQRRRSIHWSKKSITTTPTTIPPITAASGLLSLSTTTTTTTTTSTTQKRPYLAFATLATTQPITEEEREIERENTKYNLLKAIQDTQRGLTSPDQRSFIEEALVNVEGYNAGEAIDLDKLDGTWRLQYTSAPDVLVLFDAASRLPFFQDIALTDDYPFLWRYYLGNYIRSFHPKVILDCFDRHTQIRLSDSLDLVVGQIFQKFECDQHEGGYVRNVVRWSIPNLLEEQEGATLLVSAKFSVVSQRNIYLQFEEVSIENIKISEELQAVIAPALLPRSFFSLQILQFIRSFKAQIPVRNTTGRRSVGGLYYLSYLDGNMLLGRAVGSGGVFVFTRAHNLI